MSSKFEFEAIGTHWRVDIKDQLTTEQESKVLAEIRERIAVFDQVYSRFRYDSVVSRMSRNAGQYILPEDSLELFSVYRKMYDITNGLVTPLIGDTLNDAGYDAQYSLVQKKPLSQPMTWDEAMTFEYPKLTIHKPVLLDFGAAGKGYLIDIVGEILKKNVLDSYCVDAGGDIRYRNTSLQPTVIGLEHPNDTSMVIGTFPILNKSICASAGNRRKWADFHHIINPKTLTSPKHILAVWVLANTTILADALTTGLFFVWPETLQKHFDFEYLIINADYSFQKSDGFTAELFMI